MSPADAFWVGIAPMHVPALVAALLLPLAVLLVRRLRPAPVDEGCRCRRSGGGPPGCSGSPRWCTWRCRLGTSTGHCSRSRSWAAARRTPGSPSGRTRVGRWRLSSALLLVATLIAYLVVTGTGGEEPDQVGIATALVELAALGTVPGADPRAGTAPAVRPVRRLGGDGRGHVPGRDGDLGGLVRRPRRHRCPDDGRPAGRRSAASPTRGDHEPRARARRPGPGRRHHAAARRAPPDRRPGGGGRRVWPPRPGWRWRRYATLDAALAAGFVLPKPGTGPDVHMDNKAFNERTAGCSTRSGRRRSSTRSRAAGRRCSAWCSSWSAPAWPRPSRAARSPAGTRTTSASPLLPPGFGIVTPFGICPALSVNVTTPEMMHVWVVDNPGGAFAEGLDKRVGARIPRGARAAGHGR